MEKIVKSGIKVDFHIHSICSTTKDSSQILKNSNSNNFKKIASSGHNPRKFISFNDKGLSFLENETILTDLAPKFSLIIKNGKIDTSDEKTSQNLIKLLCRKGMEDPFEHIAVEVESAKTWN